jgi:hypothetical protein
LFACVLIRLVYSPFVSAIAAKIWAANPHCSNKEIREALIQSALPLPLGDSTNVPNNEFGYGLVQAVDAFQYIANNFAPPPTCSNNEMSFDFTITTDNWPEETSWEVTDSQGSQILNGGDYENEQYSFNTKACLSNECYTMTIIDTFGDG